MADCPAFRVRRGEGSVAAYGVYVTKTLRAECENLWVASVAQRIVPVPYTSYAHRLPAPLAALAKDNE